MSNDDAVRGAEGHRCTARPLVLTVAKCWDPSPQAYFTLPRSDVWLRACRWDDDGVLEGRGLSIHTDMASVTKAMAAQSWTGSSRPHVAQITIPMHFWLNVVTGSTITWRAFLSGGRPASMPVGCQGGAHPGTREQITFSEQCYYVFGDLSGGCESLDRQWVDNEAMGGQAHREA
ncbi:Segment polarity protein dishevelled-like protein DVL-2 [Camelus dromedarius]|uniref:Segment polarity protein dishevelled-like protein DVL-2 n=1 Tax=Camelus dromedarius TaxID=9838 RepID=A0A5N4D544_CAMDR|nr:Segment polarity protein dishevelled-like protein DVL-2 [Camelus dromedarius]